MFAVIFEVHPRAGRKEAYLGLAKQLKPKLEAIDGFIDNERFGSKLREGWVLSLSIWRDEKAVIRWRTQEEHHGVQEKGRGEVFADYHLRVGEVSSDTETETANALPTTRLDETTAGIAKACTITELTPSPHGDLAGRVNHLLGELDVRDGHPGLVSHEMFESITNPGKILLLASWADAATASAWRPAQPAGVGAQRHRQVRVIRDYGMFDRREAPQYYPDAQDRRQAV
jgi:heme-degrading monooxygenase HmoA